MSTTFLSALGQIGGPLTLVAFLATAFLAVFRRSVKDERGLEYVYRLFREKLTKERFYLLASRIVTLTFLACMLVFLAGMAGFLVVRFWEGGSRAEAGEISGNTVSGDLIVSGPGNDIIASDGGQVSTDGTATRSTSPHGGFAGPVHVSQIIQGGPGEGDIILSGDGSERVTIPNVGRRAHGDLRLSQQYRIDVLPDQHTTKKLRALHGLRPVAAEEAQSLFGLGQRTFPTGVSGIYAFTAPWIIGRTDEESIYLAPFQGGSAVQEIHKRPGGVFAVVGFTTQQDAEPWRSWTRRAKPLTSSCTLVPARKHGLPSPCRSRASRA